jgi:hypothetical protein
LAVSRIRTRCSFAAIASTTASASPS